MHHFNFKPSGLPYDSLDGTNINIVAFKINHINFTKINTFKTKINKNSTKSVKLRPKW